MCRRRAGLAQPGCSRKPRHGPAVPEFAPCDLHFPVISTTTGTSTPRTSGLFHECQNPPAAPVRNPLVRRTDPNGDGVTDSADFALWQSLYTGSCNCGRLFKEPLTQPLTVSRGLRIVNRELIRTRAVCRCRNIRNRQIATGDEPGPLPTPAHPPVIGDLNPMYRVHGHSGELHLEVEDLRIKGRGLDLVWDADVSLARRHEYGHRIGVGLFVQRVDRAGRQSYPPAERDGPLGCAASPE